MSRKSSARADEPQCNQNEPPDFSLVLGGPLYQLLLKSRLARPPLGLMKRRVLVLSLLAWLPLALFTLIEGNFFGGSRIPFLVDIGTHVRLLISIPALIFAEAVVHRRILPIIAEFLNRRIITAKDRVRFQEILDSTMRWRNSLGAEVTLIVLVYSVGQFLMRNQGMQADAWYQPATSTHFNAAGLWRALVSIPILQFLAFRWYYRLGLWTALLWRVSRLDLHLIPTHPDRSGGLGFLSGSAYAQVPLVFAHGALVAATIANRILFDGAILTDVKVEIAVFALFLVLLVFGPLALFAPVLIATRRRGLREYGALASNFVLGFDEKWLRKKDASAKQLLDVGDVQSLADLGNSFDMIRAMKPLPFNKEAFFQLGFAFLIPLAPLVLSIVPADELLRRAFKLLL